MSAENINECLYPLFSLDMTHISSVIVYIMQGGREISHSVLNLTNGTFTHVGRNHQHHTTPCA